MKKVAQIFGVPPYTINIFAFQMEKMDIFVGDRINGENGLRMEYLDQEKRVRIVKMVLVGAIHSSPIITASKIV